MLTFAALILIAAPALADMVTDLGLDIDVTGDAVPADSYAKSITITTRQAFDLIAVKPDDGSTVLLSPPYLKGFSPSGWVMITETADLAAAQGTPLTSGSGSSQRWTQRLSIELSPSTGPGTSPQDGDAFMVAVWGAAQDPLGEWGYEYQRVSYGLTGWKVEILGGSSEWNITREDIIHMPAPAAIGLGVLGLALVGWLKRRVG
jgi:hypothetical protein